MKIKCRRNTTSSSSSFPNSILTHLCPISWLSKFKIKGGNHEINYHPTKKKQREKQDFTSSNSSFPSSWREARFYSVDDDDDDTYWRLSFSDCRRNACGVNTLWYDSDDEFRAPFSNYNMKKVKEKQHKKKFPQMKKDVNEQRSRKPKRRAVRKKEAELESFIFPMEPEKNLEGEKFTGKKSKTEFRRRRIKQNQGRAYSSKTECRIRVLEDKLKARTKSKMNKKTGDEGKTVFDSFAVVKNSFNPQQDFRESMIEMIQEKGIRWREELEELLAAYLTLNCDEYHDVIIKVFQQVWFEVYESNIKFSLPK